MRGFPKINTMGEQAILIQFEPKIDEDLLNKILSIKNSLQENILQQKVEITNTYYSLLVYYHLPIEDAYSEISALEKLILEAKVQNKSESFLYHIPVCYDDKFALDMEVVMKAKNLSSEEVIKFHSDAIYTVYFTGFLPGFLYLGGLDKRLQISRREQPRPKVEKGAVGIGETQTGIYPQTSPGGWQIIGSSPVPLLDIKKDPPCEISAGSKIKFYPVSLEEHGQISEEVQKGHFMFEKEEYED